MDASLASSDSSHLKQQETKGQIKKKKKIMAFRSIYLMSDRV